jgi:hypothetical protein
MYNDSPRTEYYLQENIQNTAFSNMPAESWQIMHVFLPPDTIQLAEGNNFQHLL